MTAPGGVDRNVTGDVPCRRVEPACNMAIADAGRGGWEDHPAEGEGTMPGTRFRQGMGTVLVGAALLLGGPVALVVHAWTVVIAWHGWGPFAAAATFAFPLLSELVVGVAVSLRAGTVLNGYVLALGACAATWFLFAAGAAFLER